MNPSGRRSRDAAANSKEKRSRLRRAGQWLERDIWQRDLRGLPTFRRLGLHAMRVAFLLWRGLKNHESFFRAQALTYITVLSLVPLLAFGFSVAKGFGAYDTLIDRAVTPFLDSTFGPLHAETLPPEEKPVPEIVRATEQRAAEERAEQREREAEREAELEEEEEEEDARADVPLFTPRPGQDAGTRRLSPDDEGTPAEAVVIDEVQANELRKVFDQLLEFVSRTNVANLGIFGLVVLIVTSLKLMAHIEAAFNTIWSVTRARPLVRKFADYFSIIAITPLLALLAGTLAAALGLDSVKDFLRNELHLGPVVEIGLRLVPFVGFWMAFTVLGLVMPNTRVTLRSAAIGGFFSALVWTLVQIAYVRLQLGMAQYNALYSGFAAVPLFLVWVWSSWVAVLLGAEIAYADQHTEVYLRLVRGRPLDPTRRRTLGLALTVQATENFLEARPPISVESLLRRFLLPESDLEDVVGRLEGAGLIARVDGEDSSPCLTLARDPNGVRVSDVLAAIDGGEIHAEGDPGFDARAERVLYELNFELESSDRNQTLRALAERSV